MSFVDIIKSSLMISVSDDPFYPLPLCFGIMLPLDTYSLPFLTRFQLSFYHPSVAPRFQRLSIFFRLQLTGQVYVQIVLTLHVQYDQKFFGIKFYYVESMKTRFEVQIPRCLGNPFYYFLSILPSSVTAPSR